MIPIFPVNYWQSIDCKDYTHYKRNDALHYKLDNLIFRLNLMFGIFNSDDDINL